MTAMVVVVGFKESEKNGGNWLGGCGWRSEDEIEIFKENKTRSNKGPSPLVNSKNA